MSAAVWLVYQNSICQTLSPSRRIAGIYPVYDHLDSVYRRHPGIVHVIRQVGNRVRQLLQAAPGGGGKQDFQSQGFGNIGKVCLARIPGPVIFHTVRQCQRIPGSLQLDVLVREGRPGHHQQQYENQCGNPSHHESRLPSKIQRGAETPPRRCSGLFSVAAGVFRSSFSGYYFTASCNTCPPFCTYGPAVRGTVQAVCLPAPRTQARCPIRR